MASLTTNKLRALLLNPSLTPTLNLLTDTIKVMLVNTAYVPDKDHDFVSSITGSSNEISGTGYSAGFGAAGRKTLASKTVTQDNSGDVAYFSAANLTWTAINAGTIGAIAIIKEVTSDADSPILAVVDLSPDIVTNGGDFTINWAAGGLFNIG